MDRLAALERRLSALEERADAKTQVVIGVPPLTKSDVNAAIVAAVNAGGATPRQMEARRAFYALVREHNDEPSEEAIARVLEEIHGSDLAAARVALTAAQNETAELRARIARAEAALRGEGA